jgi:phosphomannomutase/phosphoglucomutase
MRLGCEVVSINDTLGVFSRGVDPIADRLLLLQKVVKGKGCSLGLGFDCDGDRLAIVDDSGRKRSGDYMLTLALSHLIPTAGAKSAVVSVDTTQAIEEVVGRFGGSVFRSKVGEANVVAMMREKKVGIGGEGSSGGLIDGSFNYCRDSMLAARIIIRALKESGTGIYDEVRSYFQTRVAFHLERSNALRAIRTLADKNKSPDMTDGLKLNLPDRSWVLIRPSGTEDVVRVSAEARTREKADEIAETYTKRLRELGK